MKREAVDVGGKANLNYLFSRSRNRILTFQCFAPLNA